MADREETNEFNIAVEVHVFDSQRFTIEDMKKEAQKVWREQPRCVVFMMGFEAYRDDNGDFVCRQHTRDFHRDPAKDYEVLEKVRKWLFSQRSAFARELHRLWGRVHPEEAWPDRALRYTPGDYARAALAVVQQETVLARIT